MWSHFEGVARTREQTLARIKALKWGDWTPEGITLHNTANPTLKMWVESGPQHDARIRNLESYYENELGWHAGPHWFVSRNWINWFSNPLLPGVHSRCWNHTRFGIEMVGDYNREPFNSGDGAMVRDNAIFLIAALNHKFGFDADDITFHVECPRDNHDCPGKHVVKEEIVARVKAEMARQAGHSAPIIPDKEDGPPDPPPTWRAPDHPAFKDNSRFTDITATVFGGPDDEQTGAYGPINWNKPGASLPYRFSGERPVVRVYVNNRSIDCPIVDVGPWNTNDPYWDQGRRPQAESGHDMRGRRTNLAGIDITPGAARALGLPVLWKGKVDWEFIKLVVEAAELSSDKDDATTLVTPPSKYSFTNLLAKIGGFFTAGGAAILYDWRVVGLLLVTVAIVIALFVDRNHIKALISKALDGLIGNK